MTIVLKVRRLWVAETRWCGVNTRTGQTYFEATSGIAGPLVKTGIQITSKNQTKPTTGTKVLGTDRNCGTSIRNDVTGMANAWKSTTPRYNTALSNPPSNTREHRLYHIRDKA